MFDPNSKYQIFQNQFEHEDSVAKKEFIYPPKRGDYRTYTVLMVAEKPSIAKSIAEALSGQNGYNSRKGACKFCQVHEYYGQMFGKKAFFKVTSVIGHVYTTDFPVGYQDWRKVDPVELFDAPTVKKESNPDSNIVQHLQQEAHGSSYVILWLDNDKEGENICYEVLNISRPNIMKEDFMQIYRAKFSSITAKDIQYAFQNLSSGPNLNESISVDARQIIDLKIGVAFSRFQTRYLVRKYQELNSKKVTYGPCQTPTLAFCCSRDDEITNFRSREFYKPIPRCFLNDGRTISLEWTQDRTYDKEEAEVIKNEIEQIGFLQVRSVENKDGTRNKPEGLNTVVMLKLASQQIGLGPQQTMHHAEKLYLGGFITYPRTESTRYPATFDFEAVVQNITRYRESQQLCQYASQILHQGIQRARHGKDQGDHPPITPTNKPPRSLNKQEATLYEMISRNFLASVSKDAKFFKKKVVFQGGNHQFQLKGTACVDQGFIQVMPWIKIHENEIPNFREGDSIKLSSVNIHQGSTQAPDHLSESDLISLMETHGIGTDASMATHIHNICERDYVQVVGVGRRLVPTQLGKSLYYGYLNIDRELVAPDLRSSIERSVDQIAKGELKSAEVLKNVLDLFKNKYIYFVSNINKFDTHFNITFSSIDQAIALAEDFTKCGRCKDSVKLLDKVHKLYCETCKFMYGLPKSISFEVAQDCFCPIDGFQLVLCTVNKMGNTRKISVCPLCYQKSPAIEDISFNKFDRVTCNSCNNRSCNYSMEYNEITHCRHCSSGGRIVLDWQQGGKQTMTCNVCSYQYVVCQNGVVYKSRNKCSYCQGYEVKIELTEMERGYHDMVFEGCIFCDPVYCRVVQQFPPHQEDKNSQFNNMSDAQNKKMNNFLNKIDPDSNKNEGGDYKSTRGGGAGRGGRGGGRGRGGGTRGGGSTRGGRGGTRGSRGGGRGGGRGGSRAGGGGGRSDNNISTPQKSQRGPRGKAAGGGLRSSGGIKNYAKQNSSEKKQYQYSNVNLSDPMSILRKPIHK